MLGFLYCVLLPLPPVPSPSLGSWFLGVLLLFRACFESCFEVKGIVKLLASYCEVQCKFSSTSRSVTVRAPRHPYGFESVLHLVGCAVNEVKWLVKKCKKREFEERVLDHFVRNLLIVFLSSALASSGLGSKVRGSEGNCSSFLVATSLVRGSVSIISKSSVHYGVISVDYSL